MSWIYQNFKKRENGQVIEGVEYHVYQNGDNFTLIMTGWEDGRESQETVKGTLDTIGSGYRLVIEKTKREGSHIYP